MNVIMYENNMLEEDEFSKPEIGEVFYLLDKINKDCKKKFFHLFEYRCVYDI